MNPECPPIEEFEALLSLDASDPRRVHLGDCPRCRARVLAFTSFMAIGPLPEGIRLDDARRRLTQSIQRETGAVQPNVERRAPLWSWFRAGRFTWRPVLALASAALVIGIGTYRIAVRDRHSEPVLRSASPAVSTGTPLASSVDGSGGLQVSWGAIPRSDGYRLHFYGTDLKEIAVIDAGPETSLRISRERLVTLGSSGTPVFWRVASVRSGDEVSLSPPATLTLP
jgi:hypothetical protein